MWIKTQNGDILKSEYFMHPVQNVYGWNIYAIKDNQRITAGIYNSKERADEILLLIQNTINNNEAFFRNQFVMVFPKN